VRDLQQLRGRGQSASQLFKDVGRFFFFLDVLKKPV
jgi:hypothetical protein